MRYPRFLLLGLLALTALASAALLEDGVQGDHGLFAPGFVDMPAGDLNPGEEPRAGDIIPGRYIVRLRDGTSPRGVAARHGLRPQVVYESSLKGFAGHLSDRAVERLRADPNVASIEPDSIVTADDLQTVPAGVDRIDADLNTAAKIDGVDDPLDVDIAILDGGIQPDHPDLRVVGGATFLGENCDGDSWADEKGHGTHVAGTAAALDNDIGVVGVAPGARLWAVRVLDASGSGSFSCVIAGIDWVTANAATIEVANMSLGGSPNPSVCDAIADSAAAGVVYAVSAGNNGFDAVNKSPANCPDVLTTSAIADFDGQPGGLDPQTATVSCGLTWDDVFACFSNYGSLVEIAAPGVQVLSTYMGSGYTTKSGTSMAAPHVAGAAALDIVVNGKPTDAAGAAAVRSRIVAGGAPQMGPLGFSGDPDSYAEPLLYLWSSDAHDVAVLSVSVPATFAQGDQVPVTAVVANRGGSSESISVTLAASGGGVSGSPQTVALDPHTVTTLSFTWDTAGLGAGDYTLTATADTVPGETYTADNTASTVVSIEHDVAVTEISTPPVIEPGDIVGVDVTAANPGNFGETFEVSLTASGGSVTGSPQPVALAPGASTTLTFTWDTTGLAAPADYTLTATASTVPGETDTANNSAEVTVTLLGHDVAVTDINAPPVVVEGDIVSVGVGAANPGGFSETFDVSLTASGGAVGGSPQSVTLPAGDSTALAFSWDTAGLAAADYTLTATASTVPGETNTADNTLSTDVTVRLPEHDVAVTAINAPSAVVQGEIVSVGVTAANPGTFSESLEVSLTVSGGSVSGSPQSVTLGADGSTRLTFAWETAGAGLGTHTLTATAAMVPGEGDPADNTLAKSLTVMASPSFVVNSALDPGSGGCDAAECTLREAITAANASPGAEVIWFDIGPGGPQTITPLSALPTMTDPLVIDATTQPGHAGAPIIELDGSSAGDDVDGLNITAGSSTVKGLVINRFGRFGIEMVTGGGNIIQGNYIGTDLSGAVDMGNSVTGIRIGDSPNNVIGGSAAGEGNVLSGNGYSGFYVWGGGATGNVLEGNYIGTTADGMGALGNGASAVFLNSAADNLIGGTAPGAGNVISASGHTGVSIWYSGATGNQVQGNLIGTDVTGTAALGNGNQGVLLNQSAANNTIGGTTPGARNVISGNGSNNSLAGVGIANSASWNAVEGNYIGTDITGTAGLGNGGEGISIRSGSHNNRIGGTAAGEGNTIAYNNADGVLVYWYGSIANTIRGNSIHSNADKGIENGVEGNTELAPPVITGSDPVSGTACAGCAVDVYSDDEDEGRVYHGSTTADGGGNWTFEGAVEGPNATATATDSLGNTSEFSAAVTVVASPVYDLAVIPGDLVVYGDDQGDMAGYTLVAGDINGDGTDDLIVGAYHGDPEGRNGAGETYVIYGGDSLPASIDLNITSADVTVYGANVDDWSSYSLAAGDINGDGADDLIIGAYEASPAGRLKAGETFVIYGGDSLPAILDLGGSGADLIVYGGSGFDRSGYSLAAGDINSDGTDDLIIGARDAYGRAGETYVFYGSQSLPPLIDLQTTSADLTVRGDDPDDNSGIAVAAGDLNDDGIEDLIIRAQLGVIGGGNQAGETYVVYGGALLPGFIDLGSTAADLTVYGDDSGYWSNSCVGTGDVNGDGTDDLIIGAGWADPGGRSAAGKTYAVYGGANLPGSIDLDSGGADVTVYGDDESDLSGHAVAAGDVNADGVDDLIIGAYLGDPNGRTNAGETYIAYGGDTLPGTIDLNSTVADLTVIGLGGSWSSHSVAAGDLNGDGIEDLMIGAPMATQAGGTYVIYGCSGDGCLLPPPSPSPTPAPTPTLTPTPTPTPTPSATPTPTPTPTPAPTPTLTPTPTSTPTPAATPTPTPTPAPTPGDTDGDAFDDEREAYLGTDPNDACADTPDANDEDPPDAWPVDFNDDQRAGMQDVIFAFVTTLAPDGLNQPATGPLVRVDVNGDTFINMQDVIYGYVTKLALYGLNTMCTP